MTKIYLGKIVSPHGIKGELKLLSNFDKLAKICKENFPIYINDKKYTLTSFRYHKQYLLISLNNYTNINEVLFLVNSDVYIEREDLELTTDEYLLEDLIGATVIEEDEKLGQISEIIMTKQYNLVRIINNQDNFLVPLISQYIISFDSANKILKTKNAKMLNIK